MENTAATEKKQMSVCPHCKMEVDPEATRCPHCRGKIKIKKADQIYQWTTGKKIAVGIFGFFVLSIAISSASNSASQNNQNTESSTASTSPNATLEQEATEYAAWQKTPAGKLCAKYPTWSEDTCNEVIAGKVSIGMPMMAVVYERGNPDHMNESNYGNGNEYQFCWDDYTPSCFYASIESGGLVTSYN